MEWQNNVIALLFKSVLSLTNKEANITFKTFIYYIVVSWILNIPN